jgi:hypothetical protein
MERRFRKFPFARTTTFCGPALALSGSRESSRREAESNIVDFFRVDVPQRYEQRLTEHEFRTTVDHSNGSFAFDSSSTSRLANIQDLMDLSSRTGPVSFSALRTASFYCEADV